MDVRQDDIGLLSIRGKIPNIIASVVNKRAFNNPALRDDLTQECWVAWFDSLQAKIDFSFQENQIIWYLKRAFDNVCRNYTWVRSAKWWSGHKCSYANTNKGYVETNARGWSKARSLNEMVSNETEFGDLLSTEQDFDSKILLDEVESIAKKVLTHNQYTALFSPSADKREMKRLAINKLRKYL